MDTKTKIDRLTYVFMKLKKEGRIRTWGDLAELADVNRATLSAAKNGNEVYLTDRLVQKIESVIDAPLGEAMPINHVRVIPTGARAGAIGDYSEGVMQCETIVSPIRGAEYAIQVVGDSMSPEYTSGSYVLMKKVDETQFIEWGKTYVLDTPNGAVLKNVRRTDDPSVVECVSVNKEYQPYTIPKDFIKGWYRVLMVMSLK